MSESAECTYADTINRAALTLLAMSFEPKLKSSLIDEIIAAVAIRGGRIDDRWIAKFELGAVFEATAARAMAILSTVLRERLPGVADEMDGAFGESLHTMLASLAHLFPTL